MLSSPGCRQRFKRPQYRFRKSTAAVTLPSNKSDQDPIISWHKIFSKLPPVGSSDVKEVGQAPTSQVTADDLIAILETSIKGAGGRSHEEVQHSQSRSNMMGLDFLAPGIEVLGRHLAA